MVKKILIIDDEEMIREVAQMSLEFGGYEVVTAGNGADGLAMAKTEQPDAILLDVMMPDRDGPSTLETLRADAGTRDIPVIFLTAKSGADHQATFVALGAAAILTKPFDPIGLPGDMARALGW